MSSDFIDWTAPSLQGKLPKLPEELPHGLITPPQRVRELLAAERAKHPADSFARVEERMLNEWTLQYYFDYLGYDVLYRQTPHGPEVIAVGFDEIFTYQKTTPEGEQARLQTWLPY